MTQIHDASEHLCLSSIQHLSICVLRFLIEKAKVPDNASDGSLDLQLRQILDVDAGLRVTSLCRTPGTPSSSHRFQQSHCGCMPFLSSRYGSHGMPWTPPRSNLPPLRDRPSFSWALEHCWGCMPLTPLVYEFPIWEMLIFLSTS